MEHVIYRQMVKEDSPRLKQMINEAFGFGEWIKDPIFLDSLLEIYLHECIVASSYSLVAVKNHQIIGIILGSADTDKKRLRRPHHFLMLAKSFTKIALTNKENKNTLREFSKVTSTYKELITGEKENFQGCIQLFIVSKESRGLGVGKSLVSQLTHYMQANQVKQLYLYTDTRCNYGFYDSQNFKRLKEKEVRFTIHKETLNVFLYGYHLPASSSH